MLLEVLFLLATLLAANYYYFHRFNKANLPPGKYTEAFNSGLNTNQHVSTTDCKSNHMTKKAVVIQGPIFRFPILGHLPLLGTNPSRTFLQWSKYYGPIIYIQMGSYPTIILNNYQIIRKAFSQNSFSGRPDIRLSKDISEGGKGLLFAEGKQAMEQRKFTQRFLKDFGFGSKSMETRILDEIPNVLQVFQEHLSKPLQVKHALNHIVLGALWSIVAGKTVSKDDEGFQKLAANVNSGSAMPSILEKLGTFVKLIPNWLPTAELSGFNRKVQGMLEIQRYLRGLVEEHRMDKVEGEPRDFIDAYLDQVEKTSDPESSFFHAHGNIIIALQDLFLAGAENVATVLEWMLFYLAKYPAVQERLQKEIEDNLGTTRLPSSEDRAKLPFVEAVIQEVLRMSPIVPVGVFHNTMEDTVLNGYSLPKDTMVLANIFGVHRDRSVWGDPESFSPDRFLHEGKLKNVEELIAFGVGKRYCIGDQLARLQIFLCTASIFQMFSVKAVKELPSEEGIYGFTLTVHPFEVEVTCRQQLE